MRAHLLKIMHLLLCLPWTICISASELPNKKTLQIEHAQHTQEPLTFQAYIAQAPHLPEPKKPLPYSWGSLWRCIGKQFDQIPFCTELHSENIALNALEITKTEDLADHAYLIPVIERAERFHRKTVLAFPTILKKLPRGTSSQSLKAILNVHSTTIPPLLRLLVSKYLSDTSMLRLSKIESQLRGEPTTTSRTLEHAFDDVPWMRRTTYGSVRARAPDQSAKGWTGDILKDLADAVSTSKRESLLGHYKWFRETIEKNSLSDQIMLGHVLSQSEFLDRKCNTASNALFGLLRQPNSQLEDIFEIVEINQEVLSPLLCLIALKLFIDRARKEFKCNKQLGIAQHSQPKTSFNTRLAQYHDRITQEITALQQSIFTNMIDTERIYASGQANEFLMPPLTPLSGTSLASTYSEPVKSGTYPPPPPRLQRAESAPSHRFMHDTTTDKANPCDSVPKDHPEELPTPLTNISSSEDSLDSLFETQLDDSLFQTGKALLNYEETSVLIK